MMALRCALSLLHKEGRLTVVDSIAFDAPKTKQLAAVLTALQASKSTLVVDGRGNENVKLSIRNMPTSSFLPPEGVNVYDLLKHDHLVVSKDAAKALEARCLEKNP
jgi:large subunit ribosomal protein L4